jgi:hypothetical protein
MPRAAGRYSGCYVRTTVSGDSSDHTLASDAHLHTCGADTRGFNNSAVSASALANRPGLNMGIAKLARAMRTPWFRPAPPLQHVSFNA